MIKRSAYSGSLGKIELKTKDCKNNKNIVIRPYYGILLPGQAFSKQEIENMKIEWRDPVEKISKNQKKEKKGFFSNFFNKKSEKK